MDEPVEAARIAFERLDALRIVIEGRLDSAADSMERYGDQVSGGFFHRLSNPKPGNPSRASSATCIAFLVESGRWNGEDRAWSSKEGVLAAALAKTPWTSAGLPPGNPFTVAFLLDAIYFIQGPGSSSGDTEKWKGVAEHVATALDGLCEEDGLPDYESPSPDDLPEAVGYHLAWLIRQLQLERGGLHIADSPPTTFLVYKAVRALRRWELLSGDLMELTRDFAWAQLYKESVLIAADTRDSDVFELAYAVLVIAATTEPTHIAPAERDAIAYALGQFFAAQRYSGDWPRSRTLFVYPSLGSAHCYDYELLTSLLQEQTLRPFFSAFEAQLSLAFTALERTAVPLGGRATGWATGHLNPSEESPESWATASVFHFCHELRRYVVDRIRDQVFTYARVVKPAGDLEPKGPVIPGSFLDSSITTNGAAPQSLKRVLSENLLKPLVGSLDRVDQGHSLPKHVPHSMIMYGPPGTSKTRLAEIIAEALGWPLLGLDPSHVTRDGYDRLHAETNLLFTMLAATERVVVLLDEFDELVQDRGSEGVAAPSRFLTTAMLPKLIELADRRRIVYLLATNHIERFDDAISRAGRFDLVLPVMPPNLEAKRSHSGWANANTRLTELAPSGTDKELTTVETKVLEQLTFLEYQQFATRVVSVTDRDGLRALIEEADASATMNKIAGLKEKSGQTWAQMVEEQAPNNRLAHP